MVYLESNNRIHGALIICPYMYIYINIFFFCYVFEKRNIILVIIIDVTIYLLDFVDYSWYIILNFEY